MTIRTSSSSKQACAAACDELSGKLRDAEPKLVVYFASPAYDPQELAKCMQGTFANALTVGCTTAGEIVSGAMLKNSVVAMGLGSDVIAEVATVMASGTDDAKCVNSAFEELEKKMGVSMRTANPKEYVGLVLMDGMSGDEERINDRIGDLTNVLFVGGSAGDDMKFDKTYVSVGERTERGAASIVLIKPKVPFHILKTQSFRKLDAILKATKVDEASRAVLEFNGKPAAEAYAAALGTTVDDLPNHFMHNPVGLDIDGEIFVRSPQQVRDGAVVFYCQVLHGAAMVVLEGTDIVADTAAALQSERKTLGGCSGILNFHCILRTLELEQQKKEQAYADLFSDVPSIGFSTYGESYIGHINQTSTMLLFR